MSSYTVDDLPVWARGLKGELEEKDHHTFHFAFKHARGGPDLVLNYSDILDFFDDIIDENIINNMNETVVKGNLKNARETVETLINPDAELKERMAGYYDTEKRAARKRKIQLNRLQNVFIPRLEAREAELDGFALAETRAKNRKNKSRKKNQKLRKKAATSIQSTYRGHRARSPTNNPQEEFEFLMDKSKKDPKMSAKLKGGKRRKKRTRKKRGGNECKDKSKEECEEKPLSLICKWGKKKRKKQVGRFMVEDNGPEHCYQFRRKKGWAAQTLIDDRKVPKYKDFIKGTKPYTEPKEFKKGGKRRSRTRKKKGGETCEEQLSELMKMYQEMQSAFQESIDLNQQLGQENGKLKDMLHAQLQGGRKKTRKNR